MTLHVLVLCDDLAGLAATSGGLDAQTLAPSEFSVTYVGRGLDDAARGRLEHLVARRPNVAARYIDGSWNDAVADAGDTPYVVLEAGDVLYPDALARLVEAPAPVVARRVGSASGVLLTAAGAELPQGGDLGARAWLDQFQAYVDAATRLPEPPVLAPRDDDAPATPLALSSDSVAWDGDRLVVTATVGSIGGAEVGVVLNGAGGREIVADSSEADGTVTATIDVAALPDGVWDVYVQTIGDDVRRARVSRGDLTSAIVHGRAFVPTLKESHLQLQAGRSRRRWFRPVAERATIGETAAGMPLALPLEGVHVAGSEPVQGSLFLGGLQIPATITTDGDGPVLRALLSGLAGSYPMATQLDQVRKTALGLTLVVDGVGAMRLEPTRAARAVAAAQAAKGPLDRVRGALPEPVVRGLRRVPGLKAWYAGR